jgi:hypothetical protein
MPGSGKNISAANAGAGIHRPFRCLRAPVGPAWRGGFVLLRTAELHEQLLKTRVFPPGRPHSSQNNARHSTTGVFSR